jgi:hypothetical protein
LSKNPLCTNHRGSSSVSGKLASKPPRKSTAGLELELPARWLKDDFMAEGFEIRVSAEQNYSILTPVKIPSEKLRESRGIFGLF